MSSLYLGQEETDGHNMNISKVVFRCFSEKQVCENKFRTQKKKFTDKEGKGKEIEKEGEER